MPQVTQLIDSGFKHRLPDSKAHELTAQTGFTVRRLFFRACLRMLSRWGPAGLATLVLSGVGKLYTCPRNSAVSGDSFDYHYCREVANLMGRGDL